ncbi:337_t:CDS:2, partial [Cetraspora pellucida]
SLSEFADEINIQLNPMWIITDFEKAIINASHCKLPNAINKLLLSSMPNWMALMIQHLFALPFLSPNKIPAGFEILKANMLSETSDMIQ